LDVISPSYLEVKAGQRVYIPVFVKNYLDGFHKVTINEPSVKEIFGSQVKKRNDLIVTYCEVKKAVEHEYENRFNECMGGMKGKDFNQCIKEHREQGEELSECIQECVKELEGTEYEHKKEKCQEMMKEYTAMTMFPVASRKYMATENDCIQNVLGSTLTLAPQETKQLLLIFKIPSNAKTLTYYEINFSASGTFASSITILNVTYGIYNITIIARAYDAFGNPLPNVKVNAYVCEANIEWCDEPYAIAKNSTLSDKNGYFELKLYPMLRVNSEYKVSVVTEKGYAETIIET
jgi:hypothetical protein